MTTWGKRIAGMVVLSAAFVAEREVRLMAQPTIEAPSVVDGWNLAAPAECGKTIPPDAQSWRGIAGARRICRADYAGTPPVRLTLVELPGVPGAGAFDAFQKWGPARPGAQCFWRGDLFGVVESPGADRATLDRFLTAAGAAIPGGPGVNRW